jgi:hypothetical protein
MCDAQLAASPLTCRLALRPGNLAWLAIVYADELSFLVGHRAATASSESKTDQSHLISARPVSSKTGHGTIRHGLHGFRHLAWGNEDSGIPSRLDETGSR